MIETKVDEQAFSFEEDQDENRQPIKAIYATEDKFLEQVQVPEFAISKPQASVAHTVNQKIE